jgi:aspartate aminotransferase
MNMSYAPISGIPEYVNAAMKFLYGEELVEQLGKRLVGVQTISGTGALRVASEFLRAFAPTGGQIYFPDKTWGNHGAIFKAAGFDDIRSYSYFDPETVGLRFDAMMCDVKAADEGSVFLFHACAHNPTGVDPTKEQWDELSALCAAKNHRVFFDCAYQGFATGDKEADAYAVRRFVQDGNCVMATQSFAKNFGIYGQRAGTLSLLCKDDEAAAAVMSQLKVLIRRNYSNPPLHGARLVQTILEDPALAAQWAEECAAMSHRIIGMRHALYDELQALGAKREWSHLVKQVGMFGFTGISPAQVDRMRDEFHVYMTQDGRMNVAGLTPKNVAMVAKALYAVTEA